MPPKKPLPADAVAALTEWVKIGAAVPGRSGDEDRATDPRKHWAFQPVKDPPVPAVRGRSPRSTTRSTRSSWRSSSDKGLSPAPRADRRTLIRRAYFDLIGLPPTAEEVEAFENDTSPDAFEKLVDRLLASPHYGERWGRHWLDVARYADTKGYVFQEDRSFPFAYTYRDYVIRAFNEDLPYDRFIIEQLAADQLAARRRQAAARRAGVPHARPAVPQQPARHHRRPHRRRHPRPDGPDRRLRPLPRPQVRPDPDRRTTTRSTASSPARTEPRELPLIGEVEADARSDRRSRRKSRSARREYSAEVAKRYAAHLKKLREPAAVAEYLRAVLGLRGKADDQTAGVRSASAT